MSTFKILNHMCEDKHPYSSPKMIQSETHIVVGHCPRVISKSEFNFPLTYPTRFTTAQAQNYLKLLTDEV